MERIFVTIYSLRFIRSEEVVTVGEDYFCNRAPFADHYLPDFNLDEQTPEKKNRRVRRDGARRRRGRLDHHDRRTPMAALQPRRRGGRL